MDWYSQIELTLVYHAMCISYIRDSLSHCVNVTKGPNRGQLIELVSQPNVMYGLCD